MVKKKRCMNGCWVIRISIFVVIPDIWTSVYYHVCWISTEISHTIHIASWHWTLCVTAVACLGVLQEW